jgi:hypothetical protein
VPFQPAVSLPAAHHEIEATSGEDKARLFWGFAIR